MTTKKRNWAAWVTIGLTVVLALLGGGMAYGQLDNQVASLTTKTSELKATQKEHGELPRG